jgi:hypothetical protein
VKRALKFIGRCQNLPGEFNDQAFAKKIDNTMTKVNSLVDGLEAGLQGGLEGDAAEVLPQGHHLRVGNLAAVVDQFGHDLGERGGQPREGDRHVGGRPRARPTGTARTSRSPR